MLVDAFAVGTPSEALRLLHTIAAKPTPLMAIPAAIQESDLQERLAAAPMNPMVAGTLASLADGLSDPVLREGLQRSFAV